jgi:hypothetical protein
MTSCPHCGRRLDDHLADTLMAFRTPPRSATGAVIIVCNPECLAALDATGWHPSTPAELDQLADHVARYGHRGGGERP